MTFGPGCSSFVEFRSIFVEILTVIESRMRIQETLHRRISLNEGSGGRRLQRQSISVCLCVTRQLLYHIYSIFALHTVAHLPAYLFIVDLFARLDFVEVETHIPLVTVYKFFTPLFQRQFLSNLLLCHLLCTEFLFPIHILNLILMILLHLRLE